MTEIQLQALGGMWEGDMADRLVDTQSMIWQAVRPQVAHGVYGKTLLDGPVKVVLTRVEPGGRFAPHQDAYGHLFYVLEGQGVVTLGAEQSDLRPGIAVQVAAGTVHSYANTGPDDLLLLSLNIARQADR